MGGSKDLGAFITRMKAPKLTRLLTQARIKRSLLSGSSQCPPFFSSLFSSPNVSAWPPFFSSFLSSL